MKYYFAVFQKYAQFGGRAQRSEYWYFFLFNLIVSFILGFADGVMGTFKDSGTGMLGGIYTLAVLIPSIAVGVRRMHDVGKSGWFLLIPIYNLILACTEGDSGGNQYGPDPKMPSSTYTGMSGGGSTSYSGPSSWSNTTTNDNISPQSTPSNFEFERRSAERASRISHLVNNSDLSNSDNQQELERLRREQNADNHFNS